ncbi:UDP-N-acetylenolpyruvoylglucosamine reductase [Epulopiscium sp. SCG-B10WGA-EpuloA2]|nr:UDP-N-acetylenolpyruvoylglucosamine reductase [Epulopiscium sp. SCG-B10WGA-EpuloA2]
MEKIIEKLSKFLTIEQIKFNEPLKNYTSFKIGGPAKILVTPFYFDEISKIINICREENKRYYLLGKGTNVLASDKGFDGVIILMSENLSHIELHENRIIAFAGAKLSKVALLAKENSLSGFEFAHGIPGTIGGAVTMNAGAYDGEIKNVLEDVLVLTPEGEIKELKNKELELGYRTSIIAKENLIVLQATIKLELATQDNITKKMQDFIQRRKNKQPLNYPSAGSTFKRPIGYFAGKLIEDAGLSGFRVGNAAVSEKHCGFVVNLGNATCEDVLILIQEVKKNVYEKFGVMLEEEIKMLN